ncbi:MAG: hypothetical protein U5L07_14785 [Desulfobacterales bacterium]|nr:hypothetical protein [Desulfobacterales bacterium]
MEITLAGINFAARSGEVLFLAAFSFFALLSFSAWLLYMAGAVASRLIARYQIYLLKRAIALFGTVVPGASTPKSASDALQVIPKTIIKDVQKSAMLVRFMATTLPNIVMLMYAFPILVYIDLSLTLGLMCLVVLFLPFFYQANIMAYESDLMAKRSGSEATKTIVSLMEDIKDFQYISPKQTKAINKAFDKGGLKDKMHSTAVYFLSISKTDLWGNILLGMCVSLVIVIQVPAALGGTTTWASLVAYLTFLRLGVNSFKGIMSFLTKFSRFYPYIHRYQHFVQSAESKPNKEDRLVIKTAAHGIYEQSAEIEIREPVRMALVTGVPLSRYSFPYMVRLGSKADNGIFVSPRECFFIGCKGLPQRDGSLRSMLNLPEGFSPKDLEQAMPRDVYEEVHKHIGTNLDKNIGEDKWEKLYLAHRVELGIVAAMLNQAKVVIIDQNTLAQIPEAKRKEVLAQLKKHKTLTVISYSEDSLKADAPGQRFGEDLCAVAGCTGNLLALGSPRWVEEKREKILNLLVKEEVRLTQGMDDDTIDEEVETDD